MPTTRKDIMFIPHLQNPFLRYAKDDETGSSKKQSSEDLGFPADTDPDDMTPEEQLAYWKNDASKWKSLSRKHEKNRRPDDFDDLVEAAGKWRAQENENLKPDERAAKEAADKARLEGRHEGVSSLLISAVRAEFKARAPHLTDDELTELIDDIDVTPERFYANDELDTERIDRLAKKLAPAPTEDEDDTDPKGPSWGLGHVLGGGQRQKGKGPSIDEVRAKTLAEFQPKK